MSNLYRGDTKDYLFTVTDGVNPIDVTGWTIWITFKLRETDTDLEAVMQVSHTVGDNITDSGPGGTFTVSLLATDTDITPGTYYYDIQRVIAGPPEKIRTLEKGKVKIVADITRSTA